MRKLFQNTLFERPFNFEQEINVEEVKQQFHILIPENKEEDSSEMELKQNKKDGHEAAQTPPSTSPSTNHQNQIERSYIIKIIPDESAKRLHAVT